MSQPYDRYDASHGSTAFPGTPLPGQPLADQPTEVVHHPDDGWDHREDTTVLGPPHGRDADYDQQPAGFWDRTDDDYYEGGRHSFPDDHDGAATNPVYRDAPVVVRRADSIAGLLLLLAGIAAGVSLLVVWVNGGATGLDLVRSGFEDLADDPRGLAGSWEPLAVVLGGVALLALGLLLFVPARTHRFLGALALLVTLVVAAGVLVPLADADWDLAAWAVGAWFTVAVAGLGFLGALKALMTDPEVR